MILTIYKQFPKSKSKKGISGSIDYTDKDRKAMVFDGLKLVAELYKPHLVWINAHGFYLAGLEPVGGDKYKYQEWFCSFGGEK